MSAKIVSKKTLLRSELFKVNRVNLILNDGKKRIHDVVERVPTVCVFPLENNGDIYLIYQYRYSFGKRIIEAVSGHVESGEKPLETAKRELMEEAGIFAKFWKKLAILELSSSVIMSKSHLFLVKDLSFGRARPVSGEEIELIKMPLEEAVRKVINGEIFHASTANGIMLLHILNW